MAKAKGFVKVMVDAPNEATNTLLQSKAFQQLTRYEAAKIYARLANGNMVARGLRMKSQVVSFKGTRRAATGVSCPSAEFARKHAGNVDWKE